MKCSGSEKAAYLLCFYLAADVLRRFMTAVKFLFIFG